MTLSGESRQCSFWHFTSRRKMAWVVPQMRVRFCHVCLQNPWHINRHIWTKFDIIKENVANAIRQQVVTGGLLSAKDILPSWENLNYQNNNPVGTACTFSSTPYFFVFLNICINFSLCKWWPSLTLLHPANSQEQISLVLSGTTQASLLWKAFHISRDAFDYM